MSTFDWGFGQPQGFGEVVPQDVGVALQDELRKSQTTAYLTPQSASPEAQKDTGLGIQNVKRGFTAKTTIDGTTVYVATSLTTSWTELYPDVLSTTIACAGRPLMVFLRGRFASMSSGPIDIRAQMEARIDKTTDAFIQPCEFTEVTVTGAPFSAFGVAQVTPGTHRFSLWVRSQYAQTPGYDQHQGVDGSLGYYLTVVEI